jgi:vacuolar-type H+-ATPase subunit E/Vma4
MGFAELEAKIKADSAREIAVVNAKADAEIKEVLAAINSFADKEVEKILSEGGRRASLSASKAVTDAKVNALRAESREKNILIDRVFESAREKILSLPDKEKAELLVRLSTNPVFDGRDYEVLVDKKYFDLVKGKKKPAFEKADLGDFGVVLKSKDGLVKVDNTMGAVISRAKSRLTPVVAKTLFGGM